MAPTACESGSQEVEVSDARGSKNRSSGGQISPPRGSNFAPRGSQTGFWSPPGASWAPGRPQEGALGGKGTVLEPFWRVLGPLLVDFPTRGEGPGRLPEVIFEAFFGRPGREAKKSQFSTYVDVFSYIFLCYVLSPVAFLAARPAAPHNCKNVKIPLVFVGRKPYAPFFRQRPKQSNFRGHA